MNPPKITIKSPNDKSEETKISSNKENQDSFEAAYKKKKTLKLLTNSNSSSEDPEKHKLFTPQPASSISESTILFLNSINCMRYPPSRKLKAQNSQELHDFFYQDEVHEVVMKRCGHKKQEDRVFWVGFYWDSGFFIIVLCESHT